MTTPINMTKIRAALFSSALVLTFAVAQPLHGMAFAPVAAASPGDTDAYAAGTRAMNEHRWRDAIKAFDQVINAKEKRADAALYWKAYSLQKADRNPLALATCLQLRSQYSSSSWNKDCAALNIDAQAENNGFVVPPIPPIPPSPPFGPSGLRGAQIHDPNTDMKILALNSLLNQDPAKAIPMLRNILTGNEPEGMKKHAIFILARSKSPEAQSILHDAITGKMDPELQRQAIMMMAVFQRKQDNSTFVEVYRTTTDPEVKKAIISAFFITQDAPHLVELARSEKDLDLKRSIVSQLAIMHDKAATDYMMELLK